MFQVISVDAAARCLYRGTAVQGIVDYAAGEAASCHVRYRFKVVSVADGHNLQPPYHAFLDHKHRRSAFMKTTLDIPDDLYKKARIMAIEHGIRLRELMIEALSRELRIQTSTHDEKVPCWNATELLPEYKALAESGQLDSPLDSTETLSDDRDRT